MAKPTTQHGFKVVDIRAFRVSLEAMADQAGVSMTTIMQACFYLGQTEPEATKKIARQLHAEKTAIHRLAAQRARQAKKA